MEKNEQYNGTVMIQMLNKNDVSTGYSLSSFFPVISGF